MRIMYGYPPKDPKSHKHFYYTAAVLSAVMTREGPVLRSFCVPVFAELSSESGTLPSSSAKFVPKYFFSLAVLHGGRGQHRPAMDIVIHIASTGCERNIMRCDKNIASTGRRLGAAGIQVLLRMRPAEGASLQLQLPNLVLRSRSAFAELCIRKKLLTLESRAGALMIH